ncbi:MAG: mismatch-specific DNA-glycosylase [Myxococcales bacterium]
MPRLRDILAPRPRILFVGINPGLRSGEVGHHFAGKGNPFWRLLYQAKLVSEPLTYETEDRLVAHGLSLTNLCQRVTRLASDLDRDELAAGRGGRLRRIGRLHPQVVALVGVTLYRQVVPEGRTPGPGEKPERLSGARLFVLPNPSGLNATFPTFQSKLVWFERLRVFQKTLDGVVAR